MRWRSGNSSATRDQPSSADHAHSESPGPGISRPLPRVDDDEQDYAGHYDDAVDDLDGCGPVGGSPSSGLPPTASHLHDDDLDDLGDLAPSLPPPDRQMNPNSLSKSSVGSALASGSSAAAVVIEDEEDDEGLDHALPTDECGNPPVPWRPQSQQSTCEFTHTITSYSQKRESGCKKAEYSATTVDAYGNRWRLIVYVNGNGRASNHHLSLFLQVADADELPFGWKKAVSYVLTLEHPSGPSLGYAKRNPDKTFKLCPKAIDWGWSQFITSDRIQQEGYIFNDSLTVRASVTVKSSSVSIDPEDAELYLKCAVEEGNAEAVEACLAQGAGVNCQFKDDLYTPLHTACSSSTSEGSLEVLKLLLKRGADGNACNKWRETPLLIAANNGHRAAVEALLESGADPSLCSEAGWSALTFAAHKGYDDIVSLLLGAGAPVNCRVTEDLSTPLHKACAGGKPGHLSAVKQLLGGGADVHALNKWRETPLLTAANHGQASAVESLLRAGADPCKCTDTGWSPLSIAAYKGHDDVVRLLLEEGAPTEEADPTLSALLQAATKGLPDTVELLLRHGADHTVTTKKGDTALSILVEQNLIDAAVEMVTEYNASVPRCSRDRKKVQRARLLINLRVKQQQRERLLKGELSDDDSEQDESDSDSNSALHDSDGSPKAAAPGSSKKKRGKKALKSFASAEAEARAAEEALLLELEQEESMAQKNEAAATSKRSKRKKKKERERQQRLQEEKLMKEKEQKEEEERKQQQIQKEEKEKRERQAKEREDKERLEREQEMERKEAVVRVEKAAAKRREKEDREKRHRDKNDRPERKATETNTLQLASRGISPAPSRKEREKASNRGRSGKKMQAETTKLKRSGEDRGMSSKPTPTNTPIVNSAPVKKRGWETAPSSVHNVSATPSKANGPNASHMPGSSSATGMSSATHTPTQPKTRVQRSAPSTPEAVTPLAQASAVAPQQSSVSVVTVQETSSFQDSVPTSSVEDQLENMAAGVVDFLGFDAHPNGIAGSAQQSSGDNSEQIRPSEAPVDVSVANTPIHARAENTAHHCVSPSASVLNDTSAQYITTSVELPSVSLFRQEKLSELLRMVSLARSAPSSPPDPLSMVDEHTLRIVIYRWIVRASHGIAPFLDPVIPSWTDDEMLTAFFQRQLISESRRGVMGNSGAGMVSIEVLKEAGSMLALLCQALAKDLAEFRRKCEQQVPHDWSDNTINVTANEVMSNDGQSTIVVIDWAGRSNIYIPSITFSKLRSRYRGMPSRLLTAVFAAVKRYETKKVVVSGTRMEFRLSSAVLSMLSGDTNTSVELWTDPLSVFGNNAFCGVFPDVDGPFGGLQPFGKEEGGGEVALVEHGGSVVVMPPLESSTTALYMRNILDSLELADKSGVPLSYIMFLPTECFTGNISAPTINNLPSLDPRLGDRHGVFVRCVEALPAGQHVYARDESDGVEISQTGSLFTLLQNEAGKIHFPVSEGAIRNILHSMAMGFAPLPDQCPPGPTMGFSEVVPEGSQGHNSMQSIGESDFGSLGGTVIGNSYGSEPRRGGHRGRLFELVDDGEDDNGNDVDVMSGMLNNLNVSMFQNNPQDVDIEAISLMGIGGSTLSGSAPHRTSGRFG